MNQQMMSLKVKQILNDVLNSYMAAIAETQEDVFKQQPILKEAYEFLNKKETLEEAKPKGVHEKMFRKFRKVTPEKRIKEKNVNMTSRIAAHSQSGPDSASRPDRGGNRIKNKISEDVQKSVELLNEALNSKDPKTLIESSGLKEVLRSVISKLIAVRLGGWREDGDYYINESNISVPKTLWTINKEGKILTKNNKPLKFDYDSLLILKGYCENV